MSVLLSGTEEITRYVKAVKQRSQNKVISTLLDGSDHVQIIGSGVTRLALEVYVDIEGRDIIDNMDAAGALVTVEDEGDIYNGRILEKEPWEKLAADIVKTNLVISVEVG